MAKQNMKTKSLRWMSVIILLAFFLGSSFGGAYAFFNTRFFMPKDGGRIGTVGGEVQDHNDPTVSLLDQDDETVNFLVVGVDEDLNNTDVILIVNLDNQRKKISVLQVPRDTYIGSASELRTPTGKINSVYGHPAKGKGKMESLISEINRDFQLTIDVYATINISQFKAIVDLLGGMEVDVPQDVFYDGNKALSAGKQRLSGTQAEWFIRYRKGYAEGDIGRLKAQQNFWKALIDRLFQVTPSEAVHLANQCIKEVTSNVTVNDVIGFYNDVKKIGKGNITFYTIKGEGINYHRGQNVFGVDREALADTLNKNFRPNSEPIPASKIPLMDISEIRADAKKNGLDGSVGGNEEERGESEESEEEGESSLVSSRERESERDEGAEEESSGVFQWGSSSKEASSSKASSGKPYVPDDAAFDYMNAGTKENSSPKGIQR